MNKWSKEEISLCKQVAEKYIKPMEYGDWWNDRKKETLLVSIKKWIMSEDIVKEEMFPLWTISDCISWLREKGFYLSINTLGEYWTCLAYKHIFNEKDKDIGPRIFFQEQTLLSVLLKIILAVFEEGK